MVNIPSMSTIPYQMNAKVKQAAMNTRHNRAVVNQTTFDGLVFQRCSLPNITTGMTHTLTHTICQSKVRMRQIEIGSNCWQRIKCFRSNQSWCSFSAVKYSVNVNGVSGWFIWNFSILRSISRYRSPFNFHYTQIDCIEMETTKRVQFMCRSCEEDMF